MKDENRYRNRPVHPHAPRHRNCQAGRRVRSLRSPFPLFALWLLAMFAVLRSEGVCEEPPKGIATKVYGKIQIVDAFPDYKVRVVNHFPDLKVQVVKSFPNAPGKWRFVESFPDFKIQFVKSGEDFTIQFVKSFPGHP